LIITKKNNLLNTTLTFWYLKYLTKKDSRSKYRATFKDKNELNWSLGIKVAEVPG